MCRRDPGAPGRRSPPSRPGCGRSLDRARHEPPARPSPASAQPDAPGMDQLLPARPFGGDLQVPWPVRLAQGYLLAPLEVSPSQLEGAPTAPPPKVVAYGRRACTIPTGARGDRSLPLPGRSHPLAVGAGIDWGRTMTSGMVMWRAGCGESRTSGSEGGPGRRAGRKACTAPCARPN